MLDFFLHAGWVMQLCVVRVPLSTTLAYMFHSEFRLESGFRVKGQLKVRGQVRSGFRVRVQVWIRVQA